MQVRYVWADPTPREGVGRDMHRSFPVEILWDGDWAVVLRKAFAEGLAVEYVPKKTDH